MERLMYSVFLTACLWGFANFFPQSEAYQNQLQQSMPSLQIVIE